MLQAAVTGVTCGDKFRATVHTRAQPTETSHRATPVSPARNASVKFITHLTLNELEQDASDGQSHVDSKEEKAVLRAD